MDGHTANYKATTSNRANYKKQEAEEEMQKGYVKLAFRKLTVSGRMQQILATAGRRSSTGVQGRIIPEHSPQQGSNEIIKILLNRSKKAYYVPKCGSTEVQNRLLPTEQAKKKVVGSSEWAADGRSDTAIR